MKALIITICSLLLPGSSGFSLLADKVVFYYSGSESDQVYVSGNFNKWCKDDPKWKMHFDKADGIWKLDVAKGEIMKLQPGNFFEFTFRVNGNLIDADKAHKNVIHCQGYGYRYVIDGL